MKNILSIGLMISLSFSAFSQKVEFSVSNPLPRVGDCITVEYAVYPDDHPIYTFEEIDAPRKPNCKDKNTQIVRGTYTKMQKEEETGTVTLGPFQFSDGDNLYTTKQLNVEVYPSLPNVRVGLWTSFIEQDGKYYLVIEQRLPGKSFNRSAMYSNMKNDSTRIMLDETKFNTSEIAVKSTRRLSRSGLKITGDMPEDEKVYSKFTLIYEIWMSKNYKDDFVLTEDYLIHFPKGEEFEKLKVKR